MLCYFMCALKNSGPEELDTPLKVSELAKHRLFAIQICSRKIPAHPWILNYKITTNEHICS